MMKSSNSDTKQDAKLSEPPRLRVLGGDKKRDRDTFEADSKPAKRISKKKKVDSDDDFSDDDSLLGELSSMRMEEEPREKRATRNVKINFMKDLSDGEGNDGVRSAAKSDDSEFVF